MGGEKEKGVGRQEIKHTRQRGIDLARALQVQLSRMCQEDAEGNIKSILLRPNLGCSALMCREQLSESNKSRL